MKKRDNDNWWDDDMRDDYKGVPDWAWDITNGLTGAAVVLSLIALIAQLVR